MRCGELCCKLLISICVGVQDAVTEGGERNKVHAIERDKEGGQGRQRGKRRE